MIEKGKKVHVKLTSSQCEKLGIQGFAEGINQTGTVDNHYTNGIDGYYIQLHGSKRIAVAASYNAVTEIKEE